MLKKQTKKHLIRHTKPAILTHIYAAVCSWAPFSAISIVLSLSFFACSASFCKKMKKKYRKNKFFRTKQLSSIFLTLRVSLQEFAMKLTLCQITPRYSEELAASRDIMTRIQPNSGALTVSFTNNFMQLWLHQFKLKIFKKEKKATVKIKHFWLQQSEKNSFTSSGCETVCTFFTLSEGAEKQLREIWHIKASCIDVTPDTKAQDKRFRWPTMLKEGRWIAWQKQTNKSYRAVYQ